MRFGLTENIITDIQHIFASVPEVTEAILYGSRAKGNFKAGSDIDIAIDGTELALRQVNKISDLLDDLYLPYTFDLSIIDQISNPDLLDHIRRVGVSLYKK